MRPAPLLFVIPLAACLQVGAGTGSGGGTGAASGATPSVRGPMSEGGPTGTNCFEDSQTHAVLCEGVDSCPAVFVDPGAYPDCGFHIHAGGALDLECLCGTALCPIGVPTTCEQAKQLLDAQSGLVVCVQQAEGRCVELVTPDAGRSPACDRSCADTCAGAPSCIQLCGC